MYLFVVHMYKKTTNYQHKVNNVNYEHDVDKNDYFLSRASDILPGCGAVNFK